jgi:hypothetical protein
MIRRRNKLNFIQFIPNVESITALKIFCETEL